MTTIVAALWLLVAMIWLLVAIGQSRLGHHAFAVVCAGVSLLSAYLSVVTQ